MTQVQTPEGFKPLASHITADATHVALHTYTIVVASDKTPDT
jgi:hypothetical protein